MPLRPQAPKCYPSKARSYLLSLRNLAFPFYNPAFAIGIGILYWLITWEFQTLVPRYGISTGKIDDLGIGTSLVSVLPYLPLYLVQAMIASLGLTAMLAGLYVTLVWYVDAIDRPGFRRYATKLLVGTAHFLAHVTAMFVLSLAVVTVNNRVAPPIERQLDALYETREKQPQIVRDVIQESLAPMKHRTGKPVETKGASPVRQLVGFTAYPVLMIAFGALVGGTLWGLYWVLTGLIARMHAEDAFAALRIQNYKNFLKLKLEPEKLTIYPLGIDRVPGPDDWLNAPRGRDGTLPNNPRLIPPKPIDVRLIEDPIVILRHDAAVD
jgi:hypothetical protein